MKSHSLAQPQEWNPRAEASVLRRLNKSAIDLITIPNEEDLFWYVAQNVVGKLNFVDCVIYQANDDLTELRQVAAWGEKNPFGRSIVNPMVIPFGNGITGQVAATKDAIIIDDLMNDQNYIRDTKVARSEICVPLLAQGRVVGVIDSEHPKPNAFGEAEIEILTTVAAMMGAKLELLAEARRSAHRYQDLLRAHAQMAQEVSARKALEAKLFDLRKTEAIGRLTGKFAHEFNNLSTTILGNLELLGLGDLSPDSREFLAEAQNAASTSANLVRSMLAFAQRTRLVPTVVNLNEVITAICAAPSNGRVPTLDLAENLWPVSVDRAAIENVFFNLIMNAQDAVTAGGDIGVRTQNLLQSGLDRGPLGGNLGTGRYVQLTVTDTGKGIPEEILSQIFDPFFTSKSVGRGPGLGLSIVQGIVHQSGGCVSVKSELGKGSSFSVALPALVDAVSNS